MLPGCVMQSFRSKANEAADDGDVDMPALNKAGEQKEATPLTALWCEPLACSNPILYCR